MTPTHDDDQLQLFQVSEAPAVQRAPAPIGAFLIRYDHAVLMAITSLISVSVVFAFGIERGKQLAREEHVVMPTFAMTPPARTLPAPITPPAMAAPIESTDRDQASGAQATVQPSATKPKAKPAKASTPKAKPAAAPSKKTSPKGRFAIQIVTYTQPKFAQRELQRLKQSGEPAFLVTRKGRVVLCVGPFPSKENAAAKLANLRRQYQDCFVRIL
jgi:hypothetical protein